MSSSSVSAPIPPLTLIVAATRSMGIGFQGALPWRLKNEMAYFSRVTKRAPPPFTRNVVVMGHKTWASIPAKFQPLPERANIVLSRNPAALQLGGEGEGVVPAGSIREGITAARTAGADGRIYVIGGAEVYKLALSQPEARNVLLTRIETEFECDTFFPVKLQEGEGGDGDWEKRSWEELCAFVGEEVPKGVQEEEDGVRYEFELWTNRRYTARSSMQM